MPWGCLGQPGREETLYGKSKRQVWALKDEMTARNLVRIDPEQAERTRKLGQYTLTFRLGPAGNRVEKYVYPQPSTYRGE